MRDRVTISYRGKAYELGRGSRYYGLWRIGAPRSAPEERWPETPDGWAAAWTRFTALEPPEAIGAAAGVAAGGVAAGVAAGDVAAGVAAGDVVEGGAGGVLAGLSRGVLPRGVLSRGVLPRGVLAQAAAWLLGLGVILGVAGLFPGYYSGASLASEPAQLVTHVAFLAGWTLSAVLLLLGAGRARAGTLLGAALSAVTFGLFFGDVAAVFSEQATSGAGLWLSAAGWLAAAAGSALAMLAQAAGRATVAPAHPRTTADLAAAVLLTLAGLGAAVTFAPNWDSYLLRTAAGQTEWLARGNAFSNSGWVIAGNVAVMVTFALIVAAAALWRPRRYGPALLAGALIPMAAQAVSALVQAAEPTPPGQLGIPAAQASQLGLTITNGLTPAFWVFTMLVVVLVSSLAWMLITASPAPAGVPRPLAGEEGTAEPAVARPAVAGPADGGQDAAAAGRPAAAATRTWPAWQPAVTDDDLWDDEDADAPASRRDAG